MEGKDAVEAKRIPRGRFAPQYAAPSHMAFQKSNCTFSNCSLDLQWALTYWRGSALSREGYAYLFPKTIKPGWVNQILCTHARAHTHTHFVISLHRLRNSRRIRVGCVPKQKSINILVKTLFWSGSGKICIKISKQTLLPNSLVERKLLRRTLQNIWKVLCLY